MLGIIRVRQSRGSVDTGKSTTRSLCHLIRRARLFEKTRGQLAEADRFGSRTLCAAAFQSLTTDTGDDGDNGNAGDTLTLVTLVTLVTLESLCQPMSMSVDGPDQAVRSGSRKRLEPVAHGAGMSATGASKTAVHEAI